MDGIQPNPVLVSEGPARLARRTVLARAEQLIRDRHPTSELLPEIVRQVEKELPEELRVTFDNPSEISTVVLEAGDRVFADLYSDSTAYEAIEAALPALRSANPREVKRYVNLFRFYAFITFRRRVHGTSPDNSQLAKLAALSIRWPDLLTTLGGSGVLEDLERHAAGDDEAWNDLLDTHDCLTAPGARSRRAGLKAFLAEGPTIGDVAPGLL